MNEYDASGPDEFTFEFELLNSDDGLTVTLVCRSDVIMTPDEFAQALHSFADRIDTIASMREAEGSTIN